MNIPPAHYLEYIPLSLAVQPAGGLSPTQGKVRRGEIVLAALAITPSAIRGAAGAVPAPNRVARHLEDIIQKYEMLIHKFSF